MSPRQRNLAVGAVVLGGFIALGWMILQFAGRTAEFLFSSGTPVTLVSDRADGLGEGSAIVYRGVSVGRVSTVRRSPDGEQIVIAALIDKGPPLPGNVKGWIRTTSMLGAASAIDLESEGPPAAKPLSAGDQIPCRYVGLAVFQEISGVAGDIRQQHLVEDVDRAVRTVEQQAVKAGAVLDSVQQTIGDERLRQNVRATVENAREASESAKRIGKSLEDTTVTLNRTANDTTAAVADARATIARTGRNVDDVTHRLGDSLDRLNKVLEQTQTITAKLDHGKGTAALLLNDPRLYEGMVDFSKTLNEAVASLRRLFDQWEHEGVSVKFK